MGPCPPPHLLPNILFPRAFTNNGLCPNHSQGRGLRGRGHPTSWWGEGGPEKGLSSVAPLRLLQTHLLPSKDTSVDSYTLRVPETPQSHGHPQTVQTPWALEALHPGILLEVLLHSKPSAPMAVPYLSRLMVPEPPNCLRPHPTEPLTQYPPTLALYPQFLGLTVGPEQDRGGTGHPKGLLP